ncbi:MAG: FAD-dependent oxidoreductase [Chitinophagaceae bacterium]|jgi:hypothetical protein
MNMINLQFLRTSGASLLLLCVAFQVRAQRSPSEFSRDIDVDVCIYGATSAGIMAAYTAKMNGKSVALIHPDGHAGGLSTGGLGFTDIGNKYVITGLARDFYRRLGSIYGKFEQWVFEPRAASTVFDQYLTRAGIRIGFDRQLVSVQKEGTLIKSIQTESALDPGPKTRSTIRARMFLDCTYEGDLMAMAGVSFTIGRESNDIYGETYNGVQMAIHHQFPDGVDPYVVRGDKRSGLLWGISPAPMAPTGSGDKLVQAYNFRLCLTDSAENRIDISRPADYDSTRYELLARVFELQPHLPLNQHYLKMDAVPNRKTDVNNKGPLSTDMIGSNHEYAMADPATRRRIVREHGSYTKGLLYFLGHDPRVPQHIRKTMLAWGYPRDEFRDNGHWTPQLYVREARRMVGEYVMTQANCQGKTKVYDPIGMAAYTMDSHNCQRIVVEKNGMAMVKNEGDVEIDGFPPYDISYRSIVPRRNECSNLLVPVCLSASHIAYGSIRMEPVFMVLAQSASLAAIQAIERGGSVQDVDVKALQARFKADPLADGSRPEFLIDNDITPELVTYSGRWKEQREGNAQFGGSYGRSLLMSDSTDEQSSLNFSVPPGVSGKYTLYVYNAGAAAFKSLAYKLNINTGEKSFDISLRTSDRHYDWLSAGTFSIDGRKDARIVIRRSGSGGALFGDAILLKPVQEGNGQ